MDVWAALGYIVPLIVVFLLGWFGYRRRVIKVLKASAKLLRELADDAEAAAVYLENPTEENRNKLLEELKDDLECIATLATLLRGEKAKR